MSFSSYDPAECTWLLTDLSHVALEVGTEDREELIQGGRHYAEMLPVEYQPDAAYTALFGRALAQSAARLAHAVGLVGDLVLAEARSRGVDPVLVSLARAGTPVGILLRRWLAQVHGVDAPHYAVSIVRGRGIDEVAVRHVLARHPAEAVRFVDGWTGKGAIARELAQALTAYPGLDPRLAVLADPGSCTDLYGTRDDFLIPSACLNSTVSGLVSRTVLRDDLIGPGMFHGAKHYAELAPSDVSGLFLDAVQDRFAEVAPQVAADGPAHRAADRRPTWAGWTAVERLAAEHGIGDVNLVKPGVGETTRVLLRRVPWQVLVRPDRSAELEHVLLLAAQRGVPVVERDDLPYSCVGLIRPARSHGRSLLGSGVTGVLIAVDLDQTVVFSRRAAGAAGPSVVVEHLDGEPLSSMTVGGAAAYARLAARHRVVPVTTRTVAQYLRITLPAPAPHAVCANGGVLLRDGAPDGDWTAWVREVCAGSAPLSQVAARLERLRDQPWVRLVRTAEDLFAYLVAHRREDVPPAELAALTADLAPLGWGVSVQGRKVYAVPDGLSKAAAVQRLRELLGAGPLLAAGDSLLDRPLLELALASGGAAVRPAHGELHELGHRGAHVTEATGARAGEELLGWLAARADELDRTGQLGQRV